LEDFGAFLAPELMVRYAALIKPEWRTLDLVSRAEQTIHRAVRLKNSEALAPFSELHATLDRRSGRHLHVAPPALRVGARHYRGRREALRRTYRDRRIEVRASRRRGVRALGSASAAVSFVDMTRGRTDVGDHLGLRFAPDSAAPSPAQPETPS